MIRSLKGQTHRDLTLKVRHKHLKKGRIILTVLDKPAEQLQREKIKLRDDALRMARSQRQRSAELHQNPQWSEQYFEEVRLRPPPPTSPLTSPPTSPPTSPRCARGTPVARSLDASACTRRRRRAVVAPLPTALTH